MTKTIRTYKGDCMNDALTSQAMSTEDGFVCSVPYPEHLPQECTASPYWLLPVVDCIPQDKTALWDFDTTNDTSPLTWDYLITQCDKTHNRMVEIFEEAHA